MIQFLRSATAAGGLLGLSVSAALAQQPAALGRVTFSGYVRDAGTGENLIGVAVVHPGSGQGTATNTYGFFSLTLPASADTTRLLVSYLGYQRQLLPVRLDRGQSLNVRLAPVASELQAVEVVGTRQEKLAQSTRMGTVNLPLNQIKAVPALFGERDVLKVLQLLPGVQSGGEGQSGLYVRGGSPDQNLILLDGAPVYNASHLFGFFSVFNADALNNVELIKGGLPARYGGRLSSVLDISMKEGNAEAFHGEAGVGLIASRLTLEGPLKKDTASFIISARRTYLDLLARPIIKRVSNGATLGYFFHDLNGKVNWKLGERDRLYLSAYTGRDEFYARTKTEYESGDYSKTRSALGWGNLTAALRWNRVLNSRLFANTHFTYSRYQFDVDVEQDERRNKDGETKTDKARLRYLSNIRDLSLKTDFDYVPRPDHYIRFGGLYTWHHFRPGATQLRSADPSADLDEFNRSSRTLAHELAVYAEDDYKVAERLKVNAGLRLNGFAVGNKFFPSVEPRLAARFLLTDEVALKAAYARTTQYIHLLTNSGIGLPTDLWVPATARVRPQQAQQVSVGVARDLRLRRASYELSLEGYYKPMRNLVEFREGANFLGTTDNNWEQKVASGRGWAYGAEVFVQKKTGRTTGWVGYTLAWSKRQFPELNQGRVFPFKYDRRHDAKLVVIHQFSDKLRLSGTWVYGTGNAVTLARGRYVLNGLESYQDFGPRNSYRMRAYHRLDLDLSKTKKKKWGEVVNSFSLYNAYSRRNPYYLLFREGYTDPNGNPVEKPAYRQISLFPILPSFSKNFKF